MSSEAVPKFFCRPWFERLWFRQEVALGAAGARIRCGTETASWKDFCRFTTFISFITPYTVTFTTDLLPSHIPGLVPELYAHRNFDSEELMNFRPQILFIQTLCAVSRLGTEGLFSVLNSPNIKCTDPRDRIYGLLGIIMAGQKKLVEDIKVYYRKTVADLHKELITAQLHKMGRADFLIYSNLSTRSSDHPTWLPKFGGTYKYSPRREGADSGAQSSLKQHDSSAIQLEGRVIGAIQRTADIGIATSGLIDGVKKLYEQRITENPDIDIFPGSPGLEFESRYFVNTFTDHWRRAIAGLKSDPLSSYPAGGTVLQAYCHVLCQRLLVPMDLDGVLSSILFVWRTSNAGWHSSCLTRV